MRSLASFIVALVSATILVFGSDAHAEDSPLKAFVQSTCPSEIPKAEKVAAFPLVLGLELLLKPLISTALDEAGAYLTSAATVKSSHMSALIERDFYTLDAKGNLSTEEAWCLVLVSPGNGKPVP